MPFCRILGILRVGARGPQLDLLQISMRMPRLVEAGWSAGLIEEASHIRFYKAWSNDSIYLKDQIDLYQAIIAAAKDEHPGIDDEALALQYGSDLAAIIRRERSLRNRASQVENNPYERAEGFWTFLASVLPHWRDRLPVNRKQVFGLLRELDMTYDDNWQGLLHDLSLSGLFRFTPNVINNIRGRIATLADGE
jgi:hypothetical protein